MVMTGGWFLLVCLPHEKKVAKHRLLILFTLMVSEDSGNLLISTNQT
jgi:hypothetical protein